MKIRLNVTPFRQMVRPLSVYSEDSRSGDQTLKLKWNIGDGIRIIGCHSPNFQTRLSVVRLDNEIYSKVDKDHLDFLTDIPTIRGLGTATGGDDLLINTTPGQDYLTIQTDNFSYNIEKVRLNWEMSLKQHFLPMGQIQLRGYLPTTKVRKYFDGAEGGPLRLKIKNGAVRFVTEVPEQKASLDITDDVILSSNDVEIEYSYNLELVSEIVKKFPVGREIELSVNEDLIRFRYELRDDAGYMNYYQRGKV